MVEIIKIKSHKGVTAGRLVLIQFTKVEGLDDNGNYCCSSSNYHLELIVLCDEEGEEQVEAEDVGVNFKEFELDLVVNHLHSVVVVDVHLVLYVQVNQHHEDQE